MHCGHIDGADSTVVITSCPCYSPALLPTMHVVHFVAFVCLCALSSGGEGLGSNCVPPRQKPVRDLVGSGSIVKRYRSKLDMTPACLKIASRFLGTSTFLAIMNHLRRVEFSVGV